MRDNPEDELKPAVGRPQALQEEYYYPSIFSSIDNRTLRVRLLLAQYNHLKLHSIKHSITWLV